MISTVGTSQAFLSRMPMTTNESMCAEVLANIIDLHVRNRSQKQPVGNCEASAQQQFIPAQDNSHDTDSTVFSSVFFKCSSCDEKFSCQENLESHEKIHETQESSKCKEILADIIDLHAKAKAKKDASKALDNNVCKYVFSGSTFVDKCSLETHAEINHHQQQKILSSPKRAEYDKKSKSKEVLEFAQFHSTPKKINVKKSHASPSAMQSNSAKKDSLPFLSSDKNVFQLENKERHASVAKVTLDARNATGQIGQELKWTSKEAFAISIGLNTSSKLKNYKCTFCEESFEELDSLKKHFTSDHSSTPSIDSTLPSSLDSTIATTTTTTTITTPTSFKCTFCNANFVNLLALDAHAKSHSQCCSSFKCSYCTGIFTNFDAFTEHVHVHIQKENNENAAEETVELSSVKCKTRGKQTLKNNTEKHCISKGGTDSNEIVGTGRDEEGSSVKRTHKDSKNILQEDNNLRADDLSVKMSKRQIKAAVNTVSSSSSSSSSVTMATATSVKRTHKDNGNVPQENEDTLRADNLSVKMAKRRTTMATAVNAASSSVTMATTTSSVIDSTPGANCSTSTTKDGKTSSNNNQNANTNSNFTPRVKFVTPRTLLKCNYCNKEFPKLGKLKRHLRIHTGEKPYQCPNCQKCFTQSGNLTHHLRTHNGDKPYMCNVCNKSFSQSSSLTIHKRSHTGERPFACSFCDKRFSHSGPLHHHIRTHTGEKPYKCQFCEKAFPQSSQLWQHVRTHTGERPYKCTQCLKKFTQSSSLSIHLRSHSGEKPFKCPHCEKSFAQSGKLHQHMRVHLAEKMVKCSWPSCCKQISSSKLAHHLWTHMREEPTAYSKQPLKCDICDRVFMQWSNLLQHLRLHTGEKVFQCKKCEKVFTQASKLSVHLKSEHVGKRPYKCRFCVKIFTQPADLTLHERTHTGEKPFTCDVCQRAFSQMGSLGRHRRIHTGEKPFQCKMCEKSFSQSSGLAQHSKTHTQEKPYSCKYCTKAFAFLSKLKEHLTIHTNEKPFRCKVCSKQFRSSSNLSNHKKHCSEAGNPSNKMGNPSATVSNKTNKDPLSASETDSVCQTQNVSQIETVTTSVPIVNIQIDSRSERTDKDAESASNSALQAESHTLVENRLLGENGELKPNLSNFTDDEFAQVYTFTVSVVEEKEDTTTSALVMESSLNNATQVSMKTAADINTIVASMDSRLSSELAMAAESSQVGIFVSGNEEAGDANRIQITIPQSSAENVEGLTLLEEGVRCFSKDQTNVDVGTILDGCTAYVIQATLPTVVERNSITCSEESDAGSILQTTMPLSKNPTNIHADSLPNFDLAVSMLKPNSNTQEESYQNNQVSSSNDQRVLEMQTFLRSSCKESTGSNGTHLLQRTVEPQHIRSDSNSYPDSSVELENSVPLRNIHILENPNNISAVHQLVNYSLAPEELEKNQNLDPTCVFTNTTTTNTVEISINNKNLNDDDNDDIVDSNISSNNSLLSVPCSISVPKFVTETTVENTENSSSVFKDFLNSSFTEQTVIGSHLTANVSPHLVNFPSETHGRINSPY